MQTNETAAQATVITYSQMVENLFKNLDTEAGTLMHAAVGMCGESIELLEGYRNLRGSTLPMSQIGDNMVEELGDWRFYAQKVWNIYGWEWHSFVLPAPSGVGPAEIIERFVVANGNMLDQCKKTWIYNRELDTLALYDHMVLALAAYRDLTLYFGWTDDYICGRNREKLLTGKKARYASGTYSDEQAQARADKQAELDEHARKLEALAGEGAAGATLQDIQ